MKGKPDTIFLIGAGFTKAAIPGAPLNSEILSKMREWGKAPTLIKCVETYKKAEHEKETDIEKLLTLLDLDAQTDDDLKAIRVQINKEIATFFSLYGFDRIKDAVPSWLGEFAENVIRPCDQIISLNYDCLLEGSLDHYGVWTPNGGYAVINNPFKEHYQPNPKGINICKIHGSVNFRESQILGENPGCTGIGFEIDKLAFPKSGVGRSFSGPQDSGPYIIAPSFIKAPHVEVLVMMNELLDIADRATNFVIIGCGMRPEDSYLHLLLNRFLLEWRRGLRLVILSRSACDVFDKIRTDYGEAFLDRVDTRIINSKLDNTAVEQLEATLKD